MVKPHFFILKGHPINGEPMEVKHHKRWIRAIKVKNGEVLLDWDIIYLGKDIRKCSLKRWYHLPKL